MKRVSLLLASFSMMLMSCNSEPTLQQYFVENIESKDFIALDLTTDILKFNKAAISADENAALETLEKMNVLAFKADEKNQKQFETERSKVQSILKDEKYQELVKSQFW